MNFCGVLKVLSVRDDDALAVPGIALAWSAAHLPTAAPAVAPFLRHRRRSQRQPTIPLVAMLRKNLRCTIRKKTISGNTDNKQQEIISEPVVNE